MLSDLNYRQALQRLLLLGACLAAFSGCGTNTEVIHGYVNPDIGKLDFDGVLVVGVTRQQKARVKFEDDFTRALRHQDVRAVASHTVAPPGKATAEEIIAAAKSAGLDTVLVTRYIGESRSDVYHPGKIYYGVAPAYGAPYYSGFDNYYAHAYEVAYQQPVWTGNVTHTLVSDLYVTATREHLWQAVTETLQASSKEEARDDAIQGLIRDLKKQGLLH